MLYPLSGLEGAAAVVVSGTEGAASVVLSVLEDTGTS